MPANLGLVGPFPEGVEPDAYDRRRRRVLWQMPTGLYLVGSLAGERRNLMTASFVVQLATTPKLVGVGIELEAWTYELVRDGGVFTISMLARTDRALVRSFVRPAVDDRERSTLNGIDYLDAPVTGAPVPRLAAGFLDCRVEREVSLGSHSLFVGEVLDVGGPVADEGAPPADLLRMEDTRMSYGG